jgi:FPC/CPF motif-containing protein YcgG
MRELHKSHLFVFLQLLPVRTLDYFERLMEQIAVDSPAFPCWNVGDAVLGRNSEWPEAA